MHLAQGLTSLNTKKRKPKKENQMITMQMVGVNKTSFISKEICQQ